MDRLSSARYKNAQQFRRNFAAIVVVIVVILLAVVFSSRFFTGDSSPNITALPSNSASTTTDQASLEDFRAALSAYKKNLAPKLDKIRKAPWNKAQLKQISAHRNMALRAFSTGNYATAISHIRSAAETATGLIKTARQKFSLLMADAVNRFDNNDYSGAWQSITAALDYNINDPKTLKIKGRIAVLPRVSRLLDQAAVARTENRLGKERDLLRRVVKLDPARTAQEKRLADLERRLTKRDFRRTISAGLAAVNSGNLATARDKLATARKIFPARTETALLMRAVKKLQHDQELQNIMAEGRRRQQADNWTAAARAFRQALVMEPDNLAALTAAKRASAVVAALRQTRDLLARPERITSPAILRYAKGLLDRLDRLAELSPTLEKRLSALNILIKATTVPVKVTVISDDKTDVSIHNFGRLNKGFHQVIRLKPGIYTFEGRRNGYRSKMVTLRIPLINPGKAVSVRIIPDEPVNP